MTSLVFTLPSPPPLIAGGASAVGRIWWGGWREGGGLGPGLQVGTDVDQNLGPETETSERVYDRDLLYSWGTWAGNHGNAEGVRREGLARFFWKKIRDEARERGRFQCFNVQWRVGPLLWVMGTETSRKAERISS